MDRNRRVFRCAGLVLSHCWLTALMGGSLSAEEAGAPGQIQGALVDSTGNMADAGQAVVFLCDADSGMPLSTATRRIVEPGQAEELFRFDGFWHAVTVDSGQFVFNDVPPGKYRLVAQAWSGIAGMARGMPKSLNSEPGEEPSAVLILLGSAEQVEVKAGEPTQVMIQPWGHESLRIVTDPEEPHNYLVISRKAPLGEGVLGPLGWGEAFIAGAIGVTRMETPHVTLVGLPESAEVHVGLWNYDNSAGVGGGTFVVGKDRPGRLPIYAGWSNGKYEPTARLKKLAEHLETADVDILELLDLKDAQWSREYFQQVWDRAEEPVQVEGYGEAKFIDVLAAESYREMAKHRRQREARRAEQRAQ